MVSEFSTQFARRVDELFDEYAPREDESDDKRTLLKVPLQPKLGKLMFEGTVTAWRQSLPPDTELAERDRSRTLHLAIQAPVPHPRLPMLFRSLRLLPTGLTDEIGLNIPSGNITWRNAPPENTAAVLNSPHLLWDAVINHSLEPDFWPELDEPAKMLNLAKLPDNVGSIQMKIAMETANTLSRGGLEIVEPGTPPPLRS